jgi:excisionase family DNA binding protein
MPATDRGTTMTRSQGSGPLTGPLLTVAEVAEVLRVSNMTVYRLIKAGDLPALRVGKNYRIRESELEAFLSAGLIDSEEVSG